VRGGCHKIIPNAIFSDASERYNTELGHRVFGTTRFGTVVPLEPRPRTKDMFDNNLGRTKLMPSYGKRSIWNYESIPVLVEPCKPVQREVDIWLRQPGRPADYLDAAEYKQDIEFLEIWDKGLGEMECCLDQTLAFGTESKTVQGQECEKIRKIIREKINALTKAMEDAINPDYSREALSVERYNTQSGHRVFGTSIFDAETLLEPRCFCKTDYAWWETPEQPGSPKHESRQAWEEAKEAKIKADVLQKIRVLAAEIDEVCPRFLRTGNPGTRQPRAWHERLWGLGRKNRDFPAHLVVEGSPRFVPDNQQKYPLIIAQSATRKDWHLRVSKELSEDCGDFLQEILKSEAKVFSEYLKNNSYFL